MRVLVMVKANRECEAGILPSAEAMAAMGKFNEELKNAGVLQALDGLQPSSKGARVKIAGKDRTVTHGPFAETSELVAGFWIWKVKDLNDAIQWAKRAPFAHDAAVEIRPIYEASDFAERFTVQHRAEAQSPSEVAVNK